MKSSFRYLACTAGVIAFSLLSVPTARAAVLLPGGTTIPTPLLPGAPAGTLLASSTQPFVTATYTGTLNAAVYRDASGRVDFYYQVVNTTPSGFPAPSTGLEATNPARLTNIPFSYIPPSGPNVPYHVDVYQRADSPGASFTSGTVASTTADRSTNGAVVAFNFGLDGGTGGGLIAPGLSSFVVIARTNAVDFRTGISNIIDGSVTSLSTFAPAGAPVPEPASLLLFGTALTAVSGLARRRLKRNA
jgi:hypothetical protein